MQLSADLKRRQAALASAAEGKPRLRVLPYTNFGSGGWSAGAGTTLDILIRLAGYENAGAEVGLKGHFRADNERLLTIDPDLILVPEGNAEYSPSAAYLRAEEVLQDLAALRKDGVVQIPAVLYQSNSHTLMEAAEVFAERAQRAREDAAQRQDSKPDDAEK